MKPAPQPFMPTRRKPTNWSIVEHNARVAAEREAKRLDAERWVAEVKARKK